MANHCKHIVECVGYPYNCATCKSCADKKGNFYVPDDSCRWIDLKHRGNK